MNREREKEGFNDKKERIVELKIEDMSREGQGIGRADGLVVFVPGAVAGDVVRAALTKVKKNYAFSRLLEIIERSSWRGQFDFAVLEGNDQNVFAEEGSEPFAEQSSEPLAEEGSEQSVELYGKSSIESLCASFADGCGGCPYGGLVYEAQLLIKERQVRETLQRLAGIDEPVVRPIIGMSAEDNEGFGPYRYRNKAQFPVSTGGIITRKGGIVENLGDPAIGFYRAKSHEVVDCEDCYLQSMAAMAAADALRAFMEEDHITAWDSKWSKGLIRHLIVKTAFATKEVMVILVINGKGIPNGQKLVAMLDEAIYEVGYSLESVVLNINKGGGAAGNDRFIRAGGATRHHKAARGNGTGASGGKRAKQRNGRGQISMSAESGGTGRNLRPGALGGEVMGDENIVLAGKPVIRDMVGDLTFEISPASFYQVNPMQTKRLYDKVREYCGFGEDRGCECQSGDDGGRKPVILDLYCGVGSIGLFCADQAEMVIGIERVKEAVLDANRNAVINGIVNARYLCGKAEEILPAYAGYRKESGNVIGTVAKGAFGTAGEVSSEDRGDIAKNVGERINMENSGQKIDASQAAVGNNRQKSQAVLGDREKIRAATAGYGGRQKNGVATGDGGKIGKDAAEDAGLKIDAELAAFVQRADIAVLDPPRAGCKPELLEAVAATGVNRIVYVSCDPATLARDIKLLGGMGYEFVEAAPVDMFPGTSNIEVTCLLSKLHVD